MVLAKLPFLAQSEPSLPILPPQKTTTGTLLQWTNLNTNRAYTVQTRDALEKGLWFAAPHSAPWPIATNQFLDTRTTVARRFFRVLAVPKSERGRLVSSSNLTNYSPTFLNSLFTNLVSSSSFTNYSPAFLNSLFTNSGIFATAQYGVSVHKLVYETVGPWGEKIQASGLLAVPQTNGPAWPLVSYQHGTMTLKSEAPSADPLGEGFLGLVFASAGYAAVLPDYLGLGDSSDIQFYYHARSTATTCVDLLRAARAFCTDQSIPLNGKVFLCGFSQGGHATLATLREIEAFHTNEFTVTAAAPMAGAYDLSGEATSDFLSGRPTSGVFVSLLLASYQTIYQLAPGWVDLLQPPYDVNLPPMLIGTNSFAEIESVLPFDGALGALQPQYLAALRNQFNHPLRLALRDNDVIDWKPLAPLRLYHCHADEVVLYANAVVTRNSFHTRGATHVELVDPDPNFSYDHGDGFLPCMQLAKEWFDSLK